MLIRHGIDAGVNAATTRRAGLSAVFFLAVTLLDWVVTWADTVVTGRTAERMLCALRIAIFAHLQRLSLDYYDHEMAGRIMTRMTTDVEALSQLVQTGLVTAVVGASRCVGVARVPRHALPAAGARCSGGAAAARDRDLAGTADTRRTPTATPATPSAT